ncbi:MAG: MBL fold metallo-hydrolase [Bacteroidota bacterium]|nr:MBL fold metallo-hydrolase [Bacteroidota bacterium]
MEFIPLGSSTDIGASCHYIGCNGHGVVVDAGADPNHEGPDSLPKLAALEGRHVEHAIITHAHHDHIGGIPEVYERFPQVAFHMTEATRTLTEMMLYASARLQRRRYMEGSSQHRPLFDEEDVDAAIQSFVSHPYERPHALGSTDMEVNLHYSGHLLGSAGVCLTDVSGRRVFYTSDTNLNAQTIIPGGRYPKQVDVLISECTLGADPVAETVTRKSEERRFLKRLQAVLDRDGTVLVPVFMLGRAQEILAMLGQFRRSGRLDPEVPIYTAGGLRNVSRIYDATRYDTPRLDPDFEVSCVEQRFFPRSYKAKRRALREPSIHVLSSGMMIENTLSNWAANQIVENEKHAVFLVGFAKEDLPAGQLLQAAAERAESVVLDRRLGPKVLACEVERFRFSGHSSRQDLLGLIDAMNPGKVVLVHGETAARDWMIAQLADRQPGLEVASPELGERIEI